MTGSVPPPLKPLPMKDRVSMIFIQYGQIDVLDGAFVVIDQTGIRTHIPVGSVACLMLEPGTRVSHAAIKLASTGVPRVRGDEPIRLERQSLSMQCSPRARG